MSRRKKRSLIGLILFLGIIFLLSYSIYWFDKKKYEPKMWIGLFDYRLNFRDLGQSLNQCLGKDVFQPHLVFRSNKYFSGWSCDKIQNPQKIYSLNYSVNEPHSYFCERPNGSKLVGIHPNTTFEISDIEILENWKRPEFKSTMCSFFKETINDLVQGSSFLFHCDVGRDRTGAFAAMLVMALAEQRNLPHEEIVSAIECDYEKTHSLESFKRGHMKAFLNETTANQGGVSAFLEKECGLTQQVMQGASSHFIRD